jgi:pimeloyl-ACP methyl ester carboxylesterase
MPTAGVNGQTIYYEVHGEGEPLLCVMGLAADTLAWTLQVPAFSERHRTIIFDNRDVGQSSQATGSYEVSDMAEDALGLADALELDSFHLLGVSMGGAIAQEMALAAPERGRTLTLAVTWASGGGWNPHPQPPEAFARQLDASSRHSTGERLGDLTTPTHVIGAEWDVLVPVWKSREIAGLIPGSKLTVLEACPHGPQRGARRGVQRRRARLHRRAGGRRSRLSS